MFSIVIPHWNNLQILKNCLESIFQSMSHTVRDKSYTSDGVTPFEIIVVDNGSTDGSREFLEQLSTKSYQLKAIFNDRNFGFAKAVNQGIEAAKNDWVVVMNNDLKIDKNWFEEIFNKIQKLENLKTQIGCIFGKVLNWEGTEVESTGLEFWLKGKAFNRGNGEPADTNKYDSPEFIFGASASIAAYYKPALEEVGSFDNDFFAYEEDVDLALRLHSAGWKTYYVPTAVSYHIGGKTSRQMGNFRNRMDAKNWWFIIIKNYPLNLIIKHGPEIFVERLRNLSGLIKNTQWYKIPTAVLATYGELLLKLPKIIRKRKPISSDKLYEISKDKHPA